jgi:hypothetical protein
MEHDVIYEMAGRDVLKPQEQLTDLERKYLRNRTPQQTKVDTAFYQLAGRIIDRQIEYTPEQVGRFQMTTLDGKVPLIQFEDFPSDSIFKMQSLNGNVVRLGLMAAAAAISYVAMNWALSQAHEARETGCSLAAERCFNVLDHHIFNTRTFTKDEQVAICRYAD